MQLLLLTQLFINCNQMCVITFTNYDHYLSTHENETNLPINAGQGNSVQ